MRHLEPPFMTSHKLGRHLIGTTTAALIDKGRRMGELYWEDFLIVSYRCVPASR